MRRAAVTLAPLAVLSTLLFSRFSEASNNPSTLTHAGTQTSSPTNSPTCTDLTKVQGPVIEFGRKGSFPYSPDSINSESTSATSH